ncbi:hypothetical protein BD414DRAFT_280932 [Trametes punicea]|nr:hypothetical protein BD414DRAFT_280932 [Trametes punicea]
MLIARGSVETEETLRRFDYSKQNFTYRTMADYDWGTDNLGAQIFHAEAPDEQVRAILNRLDNARLRRYFDIAVSYRSERHVFLIFDVLLSQVDTDVDDLRPCIDAYPSVVYCILKKYIPDGPAALPAEIALLTPTILHNLVRSADAMGIAVLAALERLAHDINALDLATYFDIMWSAALSIRSPKLVQEVLLVLHDCRTSAKTRDAVSEHAHKHALGIVFDRAEEAADACPCDETGRPKRQSTRPTRAKLVPPPPPQESSNPVGGAGPTEEETVEPSSETGKVIVVAHTRIDAPTAIRIHNHVRLQVASVDPTSTKAPPVVDALVIRASRGELYLEVKQPLPPSGRLSTGTYSMLAGPRRRQQCSMRFESWQKSVSRLARCTTSLLGWYLSKLLPIG